MQLKSFMYKTMGLSGILLLTMCQDSPFFHRHIKTNREKWYADSPAVFELTECTETYQVNVDVWIRATAEYKYKTLALVATAECDEQTIWTDTLSILLYNDKGKSTGIGFPFTEYHTEAKPLPLQKGENYKIRIRHIMRDNPVRGVTDCGIRLSK